MAYINVTHYYIRSSCIERFDSNFNFGRDVTVFCLSIKAQRLTLQLLKAFFFVKSKGFQMSINNLN